MGTDFGSAAFVPGVRTTRGGVGRARAGAVTWDGACEGFAVSVAVAPLPGAGSSLAGGAGVSTGDGSSVDAAVAARAASAGSVAGDARKRVMSANALPASPRTTHASASQTNGRRAGSCGGFEGTAAESIGALLAATFVIVGDESGGGGTESAAGMCPEARDIIAVVRSTTARARFGANGRRATARSAAA